MLENMKLRGEVESLKRTVIYLGENLNEMIMLHHAVRSISGAIILEDITEKFIKNVVDALGFRKAAFFMVDDGKTIIELKSSIGIERLPADPVVYSLTDTGRDIVRSVTSVEKILLSGFEKTRDDEFLLKMVDDESRMLLYYPMQIHGKCLGVVVLEGVQRVELPHMHLLELYINQATLALENAMMFNQLLKVNQQLKEMDALKSEFISTVSHELRTPLASIKGGVDLVLDKIVGEINEKQEHVLGISKQNVDRLTRLIEDLLDISKIEAGRVVLRRNKIFVRDLVGKAIDTVKEIASKKKMNIVAMHHGEKVAVYADEDRIMQVMVNLLSNAIKFSHEENTIDVVVHSRPEKKMVEFLVTDYGIGINIQDRLNLFQKFFQIRQEGSVVKGTGLGLAICKELVDMHGGVMFLKESMPNKGSTFAFSLPAYEKGIEEKYIIEDSVYVALKKEERLREPFSVVCLLCSSDISAKFEMMKKTAFKDLITENDKIALYGPGMVVCVLRNYGASVAAKWKDDLLKVMKARVDCEFETKVLTYPDNVRNRDEIISQIEEMSRGVIKK